MRTTRRAITVIVNIFVDESGNFSLSAKPESWCSIAAYVSPEKNRRKLNDLVHALRRDCGGALEVKLPQVSEHRYLRFMQELRLLDGIGFAVGIDVSLHTEAALVQHREGQAAKVEENKDRMHYEEARRGLVETAALIRSLPLQLYTQLVCQIQLFHSVITGATLYYSQRIPQTLGSFRWRVDRKDTIPTAYEKVFRAVLPALLQTKSFRDPLAILEGANYRYFERFNYSAETMPRYLEEEYRHAPLESAANIGMIASENFELVDSKTTPGVQVADLLASGVRRLLRGGFDDPPRAAALLGANLLQRAQKTPPVHLISLDYSGDLKSPSEHLLRIMEQTSKKMVVASPRAHAR